MQKISKLKNLNYFTNSTNFQNKKNSFSAQVDSVISTYNIYWQGNLNFAIEIKLNRQVKNKNLQNMIQFYV